MASWSLEMSLEAPTSAEALLAESTAISPESTPSTASEARRFEEILPTIEEHPMLEMSLPVDCLPLPEEHRLLEQSHPPQERQLLEPRSSPEQRQKLEYLTAAAVNTSVDLEERSAADYTCDEVGNIPSFA